MRRCCLLRPMGSGGATPRVLRLASIGSLSSLVESASLAFLFTFAVVCGLAFLRRAGSRLLSGAGAVGAGAATAALVVRLGRTAPVALGAFAAMVAVAVFGRPLILRMIRGPGDPGGDA